MLSLVLPSASENETPKHETSAVSLNRSILAATHVFDGLASDELDMLALNAELHELRRGEVLVREGESSDALYFVVSGRFSVYNEATDETFGDVGQGQPIGEVGFFSNIPRTATVTARRDSQVLAITRDRFEQIGSLSPGIWNAVIQSLSSRLAKHGHSKKQPVMPRTVAVVMAGDSRPSPRFIELLRGVFGSKDRALFLTRHVVEQRFPGASLDDPETSRWFNSREADADFVFYLADEALTEWTQKCVRQADVVLFVAVAGSGTRLNPSEHFAVSLHAPSARRLVVLHDVRTQVTSGTSAWLDERDVFMHHHVALQDADDVHRLHRFLSGRAVGFVAGGGGALGSAHLGVYKAFAEAGAEFDIFGGTSVGAAMAAGLTICRSPEEVDAGTRNIFVKSRAFRRYTLPYYSLLNHKVLDKALRNEYRDLLIEDLWKPFFALSTNLNKNEIMVHRRGPVWRAVRASSSIPGVLPPCFTTEGEMLVEGSLLENVPLTTMHALKTGPNVVVALKKPESMTYDIDYDLIPGPREWIKSWLNPFSSRRLPRAPHMLQVIMSSMFANREGYLSLNSTDTLIHPQIPSDLRWTKWERHTEVFLGAYRAAVELIQKRVAETDTGVTAVLAQASAVVDELRRRRAA